VAERGLEAKVGALVFVCLLLLGGFVYLLGDYGRAVGFPIAVDFPTSSDIKPGAPVKIAGVTAGRVGRVEYMGGKIDEATGQRVIVRIHLDLDPEMGSTLHDDARFYISTLGVLGEKYIEVDPGSWERPNVEPGMALRGEEPLRMEKLAEQVTRLANAVVRIVEDNEKAVGQTLKHIDEAAVSARDLARNTDGLIAENRDALRATVDKVSAASDRIDRVAAAIEGAVGDGKGIARTLRHVERVSARLDEDGAGALKDTRRVASNLRTFSERLKDKPVAEVALGPDGQATLDRMLTRLEATADDVKAIGTRAREGKGTIGGLLMDNELFMDLKLLLKDLKRHPWKFMWRE
jgi:phospholipid/cholesterol/gamma-HCH transport system substrate-binding protein